MPALHASGAPGLPRPHCPGVHPEPKRAGSRGSSMGGVGFLAEAVLVLPSCPAKPQWALAIVGNDSPSPREGKPSLYMRRKKTNQTIKTRLPKRCPCGAPQSAVLGSSVEVETCLNTGLCFLAQECPSGLGICIRRWSPQQCESGGTPTPRRCTFHHYRFISLGLRGRASGTYWYFGQKGDVMRIP